MPRTPDMPCATCGQLMWRGSTSLPEGRATCHPCRRKSRAYLDREVRKAASTYVPELRACRICNTLFETHRPNQVYCTAECRNARHGWSRHKAPTDSRGYGKEHRKERARWSKVVNAGQADCCLCGYWIEPGSEWHLDHTPDRTGYRGAAHAECNRRDGAKRANRRSRGLI